MTSMNTDGPGADRQCPAEEFSGRVIIHVDLDCFYAQVEHKRCKIPRNEPLAVQQWYVSRGLVCLQEFEYAFVFPLVGESEAGCA